jgi:hypothetical protein
VRKLVLLLAAALIVSVPVVTMSSSDTFAAAKAKKAAGKAKAPEAETGGLFRAFSDQARPQAQPAPKGMARVARAKRAKKKGGATE